MFRLSTKIATIAVSAVVALTGVSPSFAMPLPAAAIVAPSASAAPDVEQVQWRHGGGGYRRGWYGGHRGYPTYRRGYRYHDGYWFPLAAFGAGALIGGAIASQPRYVAPPPATGLNPRHYEWCANRYRSYRAYDNSFQPNNGPRRECLSPYY